MNVSYGELIKRYSRRAPMGFKEFAKVHGNPAPNTCAVRLAYALFLANRRFFKEYDAKLEWYGLPTRASELAIMLNKRLGKAHRVGKRDIRNKKGIIFFDTITGFSGSGHISLWDGAKVVDEGDYFQSSPRAYFWALP